MLCKSFINEIIYWLCFTRILHDALDAISLNIDLWCFKCKLWLSYTTIWYMGSVYLKS